MSLGGVYGLVAVLGAVAALCGGVLGHSWGALVGGSMEMVMGLVLREAYLNRFRGRIR